MRCVGSERLGKAVWMIAMLCFLIEVVAKWLYIYQLLTNWTLKLIYIHGIY